MKLGRILLRVGLLLVISILLVGESGAQEPTPGVILAATWQGTIALPVDQAAEVEEWNLVFHYELRAEGRPEVWALEVLTSTCRPTLGAPGEGDCGLDPPVAWDTSELPTGVYDVWVRAMWTNGNIDENTFCNITGALNAGDEWYLIDKLEIGSMYLPLRIEVR